MTTDERRTLIREQAAAAAAVLRKHGVDAKELARTEAKLGREGAARARRAAEAAREAPKEELPAEKVAVQRGFSDKQPVTLEEGSEAPPTVEEGIPVDED